MADRAWVLGAWLIVAGCHARASQPPGAASPPNPFAARNYPDGPIDPATRVFLVAGGDDTANFAQEVADQRALWLESGALPSSVACYWAQPDDEAWLGDRKQFRALEVSMRPCRRADPATLRADLLSIAKLQPAWIYLFVTSHGLPPILRWRLQTREQRPVAEHFELSYADVARLDLPAIGLEGGAGPRLGEVDALVQRHRQGVPLGDLVLSPGTLADTLTQFGPQTKKVVVLQACFSGGFIANTAPDADEDDHDTALTRVRNVTVLTATAANRPSFGCGAGSSTTYFGGAFNKALARALARGTSPPAVPWRQVWEDAAFIVDAMESVEGERPSRPAFFSSDDVTPNGSSADR